MADKKVLGLVLLTVFFSLGFSSVAFGRDQIRIVGSSTVYPFTTTVAERFGRNSGMKVPVVESTGTGGGMKLFCAGFGQDQPDFANASRPIKKSEYDNCVKNGVTDLIEIKVGIDAITIAQAKNGPPFSLSRKQAFMALAKQVPDKDGKLVTNAYRNWHEIDASLPDIKIEVLGPPPTSGTRDSFLELVMEKGAEEIEPLKALKQSDPEVFERVWKTIRSDGAYIEAGENDNLIVQKLATNPNALGIFGFSFLEQNGNIVRAVAIEGVMPGYESVVSGNYPVTRPLYLYAKAQNIGIVPGIKEFIAEYVSPKATGEDGYLVDKGLIPLPEEEAAANRIRVEQLKTLLPEDIK